MRLESLKLEIDRIKNKKIGLKNFIDMYIHIILIGNGGSNSIASHIAQDYTKMLGKKAICFSDPSRLTCYINDYGRDEAYKKFLEHFCNSNTLVILMSSSGRSENILNAARYCEKSAIKYIALSGFDEDNPLNKMQSTEISYHVKSHDYGVVESAHMAFLHSIIGEDDEKTKGIIAGAFDVIHPGYTRMFGKAKKHCTHLTVAIHEDPSTERGYKLQPVQTAEEKKEILLSMKDVDVVVDYKKEEQLLDYLRSGKYDIRFLGTDYKTKSYSGANIPIDIVWLEREVPDYTSTQLKTQIYQSVSDKMKETLNYD